MNRIKAIILRMLEAANKRKRAVLTMELDKAAEQGGIGTTLFYILGSMLAIGCGIMLVSRRRVRQD